MTVKELIKNLKKVENQDSEILIYSDYNGDFYNIEFIDSNMDNEVYLHIED